MKTVVGLAAFFLLSTAVRADLPTALPSSSTPQYTITDLGLTPQWNPAEYKKNASIMLGGVLLHIGPQGQVAGAITQYADKKHTYHFVFRWAGGKITSTMKRPVVIIFDGYQYQTSAVTALNFEGAAVISIPTKPAKNNPLLTSRPYLWDKNRFQSLGTWPKAWGMIGEGINRRGEIICTVSLAPLQGRAFVWRQGKRKILPTPPPYDYVGGFLINDQGDAVGTSTRISDNEGFKKQVVVYHNGRLQSPNDPPGNQTASAIALNSSGEVLVSAINYVPAEGMPPLIEQDFLWAKGKWQALGTKLGSQVTCRYGPALSTVTAMNVSHQIVGWYGKYKDPDQRAFLFQKGVRQDLDTLIPAATGWKLIIACDINDAGQIVGYGKHNGKDRMFLLNPIKRGSYLQK